MLKRYSKTPLNCRGATFFFSTLFSLDIDDIGIFFEDQDESEDESTYVKFNVGVLDLLEFGGPNMMRNGEEVYKASHLLDLGVMSQGNDSYVLEGICLQSSHPSESPHTLTIRTAHNFKQWSFHCSCKAGNGGKCKHVYAALLHIHTEKKLEVVTCTQRKKSWGKISKEVAASVLEPELIRNLPEMKHHQRKNYEVTKDEYDSFQQILFNDPNSAVAVFLERHNSCEASKPTPEPCASSSRSADVVDESEVKKFLTALFDLTNFQLRIFIFNNTDRTLVNFYYQRICVNVGEAIDLAIKTQDQNNALWSFERKLRITASECYRLYTASKNANVDWTSKIRNYYKQKPNLECFKIGRKEEANGLKLYERQTGTTVEKIGLVVHPSCPWLACSPDGVVLDTKTVVEVKTLTKANEPIAVVLSSVKYLCKKDGKVELRKKHLYYGQIQVNMHLLQCKNADMVIHNFKLKEILIVGVVYDEEFCLQLVNALKSVFYNHALPYIYENCVTGTDKKNYA